MIPGDNILDSVFKIIGTSTFEYYQALTPTLNAVGQQINAYAAPLTLIGSVQPLKKSLYEKLGLDLQKTYINVFVEKDIIGIGRDVSPDKIFFNGNTYQCLSSEDWFGIDGWLVILCVLVINP